MPLDLQSLFTGFAPSIQPNRPNLGGFLPQQPSLIPSIQEPRGLERLMQLLQNVPQREEPSLLRRIGSALASFQPAGYTQTGAPRGIQFNPERFEELKYRPYQRKLQDFSTQLQATLPLAELEQKTQQEKRLLRGQTFEQELKSAQFVRDLQNDARQGRLDEARIKEIEDRIQRNDFINLGQQDDGSYLIMDKRSGQPVQIQGNNLTTEQKIRLEQSAIAQRQGMIEGIRQGGQERRLERGIEGQKELEETRQRGRTELERTRQEGRRELRRSSLSPTQQGRELFNRAQEVINQNPELAPYVELGTNNKVRVLPLDEINLSGIDYFSGENKEENRQRAIDLIYGGSQEGDKELRDEAIKYIQDNSLPMSEEGIKYIMDQLRNK